MNERVVIEDHPDYEIDIHGRVWSNWFNRYLIPDTTDRYSYVKLDGRKVCIHRLMGKYFIERTSPNRSMIFHIDGNQHNNDAINLVWLSPSELQRASRMVIEARRRYVNDILHQEECEDESLES